MTHAVLPQVAVWMVNHPPPRKAFRIITRKSKKASVKKEAQEAYSITDAPGGAGG
jgi:hypothetical protein